MRYELDGIDRKIKKIQDIPEQNLDSCNSLDYTRNGIKIGINFLAKSLGSNIKDPEKGDLDNIDSLFQDSTKKMQELSDAHRLDPRVKAEYDALKQQFTGMVSEISAYVKEKKIGKIFLINILIKDQNLQILLRSSQR